MYQVWDYISGKLKKDLQYQADVWNIDYFKCLLLVEVNFVCIAVCLLCEYIGVMMNKLVLINYYFKYLQANQLCFDEVNFENQCLM
jgi:hypothetical protein